MGCATERASVGANDGSTGVGISDADTSADESGAEGGATPTAGAETDGAGRLDVEEPEPPAPSCGVMGASDGVRSCTARAPAESFDAVTQWEFPAPGMSLHSIVTPLVANLTDDNGNGKIDLCDTPDVVLVANTGPASPASIYILDGATGALHTKIDGGFTRAATPALGDIDGDGRIEIVMPTGDLEQTALTAYHPDGSLLWRSEEHPFDAEEAVALADLDADGDVEIMLGHSVFDHRGRLIFLGDPPSAPGVSWRMSTTTAADLDDDGDLEVIVGNAAYHHDGTLAWDSGLGPGHPAVANFDEDDAPEILLAHDDGFSRIEHDGTITWGIRNPTGDVEYARPPTVHDIDGDGAADFALSSSNNYSAYHRDETLLFRVAVVDESGNASGTAFDFLGDGTAEAIYGDERNLWVYDDTGEVKMSASRSSLTWIEYPVVADVDNDESSEILVVSNDGAEPALRVLRDRDDRWVPSRRIWNQHTYHVTNVREDGIIPRVEPKHWLRLNTFRTNAQSEQGEACMPVG